MKTLLLSLTILLSVFYTCSSNPTQPPPPPSVPDSTTQNFTFQTYEFGDGFSSSYLNDVWIFNENNIWAVGDIGPNNNEAGTNILRWNGKQWYRFEREFVSTGFTGIWAADSNNIYLASNLIRKYEYGTIKTIDLTHLSFSQGQGIHKLWGSSESNIWGVGPWGTIVHYDGNKWTKIDFDQQWRFDAITGSEKTGIAYACATDQSFNTAIVELKNNSANIIYNSVNSEKHLTAFNIKMITDSTFYLSDQQVWKYNIYSKSTMIIDQLPGGYFLPLVGTANKIDTYFFGGKYQQGDFMVHYNGKRLKEFSLFGRIGTIYGGAYAIKDFAIMVAKSNNKAYLVEVRRR